MTKTENYQLNQWDAADPIRREDFNADNAALDAALNAIKNAAEEDMQSLGETVAAVAADLGTVGQNARFVWGRYMGTGTYGESNPTVLTFDFKPMVIFIAQERAVSNTAGFISVIRGTPLTVYIDNYCSYITWLDNGISFFNYSSAAYQANEAQRYYSYVAIGQDLNT
ncbi:MAG: hypothetical protein ACI4O5_06165 [Oscillospiraceae bacterium]